MEKGKKIYDHARLLNVAGPWIFSISVAMFILSSMLIVPGLINLGLSGSQAYNDLKLCFLRSDTGKAEAINNEFRLGYWLILAAFVIVSLCLSFLLAYTVVLRGALIRMGAQKGLGILRESEGDSVNAEKEDAEEEEDVPEEDSRT